MGKYDDLASDVTSLLKRIVEPSRRSPDDPGFVDLIRDLNRALAGVATLVPSHQRLFLDRTRVSNEFRAAIDRYVATEEPLVAPVLLKECLETSVLPYVRSAAYEDTVRINRTVDAFQNIEGVAIEKWKLQELIGTGGNSVVHRAKHTISGFVACVKLIPLIPMQEAEQLDRFYKELMVPARVGHESLVAVLDGGEIDAPIKALYIVMELIDGDHLNVWSRKRQRSEVISAYLRLLTPLTLCHEHGLVHRDLKPSNVMVARDGRVRILDFGHAAISGSGGHTRSGQFIGTVNYVSPEQAIDARSATHKSDIWSLGVMLYELLTGLKVFPQDSDAEVIAAVLGGQFAPPENHLLALLASIVRRCLQIDPSLRYGDVKELFDAILASSASGTKYANDETRIRPLPLPKQEVIPSPIDYGPYVPAEDLAMAVPVAEPVVSRYTLQFDSCGFCHSVGRWNGNRCARCGRDRGTD